MRTSQECTAKALELDGRAEEASAGPVRDGFVMMAQHWRRLAVTAAHQEATASQHEPPNDELPAK